jgi:predicted  nucleic acid-binding Zn-ribbon protein
MSTNQPTLSQEAQQTYPNPEATADTTSLADEIRKQVETEQALADATKRLRELEDELEKVKRDKETIEGEKEGASESTERLQACVGFRRS